MADKALPDYPARLGDKQLVVVDHTGPASYTTGGETLGNATTSNGVAITGLSAIDEIEGSGSLSISGNFFVLAQPTGTGMRKTWKLLWFAVTLPAGVLTLTQVANAASLAAETVRLGYIGR